MSDLSHLQAKVQTIFHWYKRKPFFIGLYFLSFDLYGMSIVTLTTLGYFLFHTFMLGQITYFYPFLLGQLRGKLQFSLLFVGSVTGQTTLFTPFCWASLGANLRVLPLFVGSVPLEPHFCY